MKITIYVVNFNQFAILTNLKCLKLDILTKENRLPQIHKWYNLQLVELGIRSNW